MRPQDEDRPIDPGPAWLGPKASEEDEGKPAGRIAGGLSLRAVIPSAITAAAICAGLTGIRFGISGEWEKALLAILLAGLLDGIDGRIARLLNAQSRFGAEVDSLADSIDFGVAPALVLFMWSLQDLPRFGWFASLLFAICCVLRLARFNARIDLDEQPHKSAGYLTGVPAPVGAGLAFFPMYLWIASGEEMFRQPWLVAIWVVAMAVLMISNIATLSWKSFRPRRSIRLEAIAVAGLLFAALLTEPWWTLVVICAIYLALMPYAVWSYARVRRRRAERDADAEKKPVEPFDVTGVPR
ncbi:CDP-diacylglycerol--serine O-phosphatidyltransferase [Paraurantiacibacter namhicola]|uniref:CDP-diacylglycerol--serine O-phosphatidyltransferase n=1 Tax=Paraurantiacibacter namhicola TaxID=645517 RepID=A0A1C7D9V2_9SPHN|nr:CDP-alcohol phosphatidyltransferase [Paraurantiacibacter namhicola]